MVFKPFVLRIPTLIIHQIKETIRILVLSLSDILNVFIIMPGWWLDWNLKEKKNHFFYFFVWSNPHLN